MSTNMNFRFAHYDPPKKKPPKPRGSTKARIKLVNHPAKVVHRQRRKSVETANEPQEEDDIGSQRSSPRRSSSSSHYLNSTKSKSLHSTPLIPSSKPPALDAIEPSTVIRHYLSQSRLDPFRVYSVENVPIYVNEVLDHVVRNKWARVSPGDATATRHGWMQCALSNPVAFYALTYAASQYYNYLNQGRDPSPNVALLRLSYKTEAVKLINAQLSTLGPSPIPDALLIAILSLGAHGHKPVPPSSPSTNALRGPASPLATAQMIDFYGHIDQETAHMSALRTLLAHNKGVSGIELPGLAGALALGDLLHSTITHQKPSLPAGIPITAIPGVVQFLPAEDPDTFSPRITFPLRRAASIPDNGPATKLLNTLTLAQTVTTALDRRQHPPDPLAQETLLMISMEALTYARNHVHHSLLSLPEANALWGSQFALYDALRIAALIYSDLVLFPLPAETGVRGRYAGMLRNVLAGVGGAWGVEGEVLLWACVMGAVAAGETCQQRPYARGNENSAARGAVRAEHVEDIMVMQYADCVGLGEGEWMEERTWFLAKVRMCAEMLGVGLGPVREVGGFSAAGRRCGRALDKSWAEFKKVCSKFLWWDDVCDVVGRGVWEEVMLLQCAMVDAGMEEGMGIDVRGGERARAGGEKEEADAFML